MIDYISKYNIDLVYPSKAEEDSNRSILNKCFSLCLDEILYYKYITPITGLYITGDIFIPPYYIEPLRYKDKYAIGRTTYKLIVCDREDCSTFFRVLEPYYNIHWCKNADYEFISLDEYLYTHPYKLYVEEERDIHSDELRLLNYMDI